MRPPCEIVQKEYLPAVRSMLAIALHERGMSQSRVAEQLEITQAAVSKYFSSPILPMIGRDAIEHLVDDLVDSIVRGEATSDQMVQALCSTCMMLRVGGDICRRHREVVNSLERTECTICTHLLGGEGPLRGRTQVLMEMEKAVQTIEQCREFVRLLPEVRASLVACSENATTPDEVAGVPGRITDVGGLPRAPARPAFGASRHTAEILLRVKENLPQVRACMCVAADDEIINLVKRAGYRTSLLDRPTGDADEIGRAAGDVLRGTRAKKLAVQVPGGMGIEPVLYLFGESPQTLATDCVRIAKLLAEDQQ